MIIFGVQVSIWAVTVVILVIIGIIALIVSSVISEKNKDIADLDTRETFGNFHGLLTQEDFDVRSTDPNLEMYRKQWISAKPGDEKDSYLLLYLALKQLNKEQDESEEEWTQEACESRMDEIIEELSEKTGLKLLENELDEDEYDMYFNEDGEDDDTDGEDTDGDGENEFKESEDGELNEDQA